MNQSNLMEFEKEVCNSHNTQMVRDSGTMRKLGEILYLMVDFDDEVEGIAIDLGIASSLIANPNCASPGRLWSDPL